MLVDVTAVLTSSTLDAVAEAFSMPAAAPVVISAPAVPTADQLAWARATDPQTPVTDPASAAPLTGYELLAARPSASVVASWWATADEAARALLLTGSPQAVGNLEGLPYGVRDDANREALAQSLADVEARLADPATGRAAAADLRAQLHMLQQVAEAIETGDSGLPRALIGFNAGDGGRAVIAVGDLRSAEYVTFLVPGMFYSVDNEIGSWAGAADALAVDQARWLERLTPAQHGPAAAGVATVAWIGYQTPTVADVASLDLAREGRDALTASLRGLGAVRAGEAPYLSVLAHSYGATATLLALQENDVTIDALAMVGSPGSPADHVGELKVRDGNVWVADAALDPVATAGVFGSQPLSAAYGARHFGVDGAVDPITGRTLAGSVGHVDYFTAGSESFRNMALIALGREGYVLDPQGSYAAAPRAHGSGTTIR